MAIQLVIPTDPIARKNLWRDLDPSRLAPGGNQANFHEATRLVAPEQRFGDQRFDVAVIINDIKTNHSTNQYRIDPKPKPTWQWVASILLVEAAILMIGWKILVGF